MSLLEPTCRGEACGPWRLLLLVSTRCGWRNFLKCRWQRHVVRLFDRDCCDDHALDREVLSTTRQLHGLGLCTEKFLGFNACMKRMQQKTLQATGTSQRAKNEKLNVIACHLLLQYDWACNYCKICARASKAAKRNSRTSESNVTKQNANGRFQPCRAVETTNRSEKKW